VGRHEILKPNWPWAENLGLTWAVRKGEVVYVSGLVGFDAKGNIARDDMYGQTAQVLRNLKEIMEIAGGSQDDIVKITCYLADLSRFKEFARARAEAFAKGLPANTAIGAQLALPELLVEIEAIGIVPIAGRKAGAGRTMRNAAPAENSYPGKKEDV
jgi:enamine deaminase RidA (YjgF/YER057c/UK114 family)